LDAPCPPSEPLETFADIAKAGAILGYAPQTKVEEGLTYFVEWMREQGQL
jgi:nucleoside-diphosphate-sugar epimerase